MVHRAALALVLSLVAGCSSAPPADDPYSRTQLLKDPAVELVYPGATRLEPSGRERQRTLEGAEIPAAAGYRFRTTADRAALGAFYDAELTRLGWLPSRPPILGTGEESAVHQGWCKPGMIFRLAFKLNSVPAEGGRYFTAEVVASRYPCPDPL